MTKSTDVQLKLSKITQNLKSPTNTGHFHSSIPSQLAFLLNSRWQNRKERPNRFTNNEDIAKTDNRYIVCE